MDYKLQFVDSGKSNSETLNCQQILKIEGEIVSKTIYKITINNWDKHNSNKKKNHRYFLLENRFFEDAKISNLRQIEVLLFLKCLCIAGDLSSSCIEIHAGLMPRRWRIDDKLMENCCKTLQENQLLTYEKSSLIQYNTREKNIKEEKIKETNTRSKTTDLQKEQNRKIKEAYFEAYRLRYGFDPIADKIFNTQVSRLRERVGTETAIKLVKFYLTHNKTFYAQNTHKFGLCLSDAETLRTQMLNGKAILDHHVKSLEKHLALNELLTKDI